MKALPCALLKFYQQSLSHYWPGQCRYYPTCSEYSRQAIESRGLLQGTVLTIRRLARCHPFGGRGYDSVPE